jgi:hypothetical protein
MGDGVDTQISPNAMVLVCLGGEQEKKRKKEGAQTRVQTSECNQLVPKRARMAD